MLKDINQELANNCLRKVMSSIGVITEMFLKSPSCLTQWLESMKYLVIVS